MKLDLPVFTWPVATTNTPRERAIGDIACAVAVVESNVLAAQYYAAIGGFVEGPERRWARRVTSSSQAAGLASPALASTET